ncbi:MAG: phenylalanine--tRNA ligase subunit beta [Actinomycetota bacterium]
MKVPLSWLREFAPVEASADELARRLPVHGLAVEEVVRTGADISGVVVARVLEIEEVPGANKVILARVDAGEGVREVFVGVRNIAPGDLVPYATPGSRLPGGREIGRKEMFGRASEGMLCSAAELAISDDHSGILVLDGEAKLGQDVREALALEDEILEIDVTPNRPDCLSIVGVAREVAALYGLPLTIPPVDLAEDGAAAADQATVTIEDARGCPRYLARVITGVRVGPSPWWMQRRLLACGMRPISGPVDVTNYVLLERGHPQHAFDLAKLRGGAIVVRRPRKGERTIVTLDGVERALERDDVLICDREGPVAVGGIMGGAESEVGEGTTAILLEAAYFDQKRILRTARRLGLRTEASVRFERGADPEAVPAASARAAALLAAISGGAVALGAIDVYPKPIKTKPIRLRIARANGLLGITQTADEMAANLKVLGCAVESQTRTGLRVVPPTFRPDLRIEPDLIEEIARLYSYERIPTTLPASGRAGGLTEEQALRRLVRRLMLASGLSEAQTLSMLPPSLPERLGLAPDHPWRDTLVLANPLSEEESVLRPSLIPGLLLAAAKNVARRNTSVSLFEIGNTFMPSDAVLPIERLQVAWLQTGNVPTGWHRPHRNYDFFDAKGVLERLAGGLGVEGVSVEAAERQPMHPGRTARVLLRGEEIGIVAELSPRAARAFDLASRVAVAEIRLEPLLAAARTAAPGDLPRFPAVSRDLALLVPGTRPAAEVEAAIRRAGGALLERVEVFDVYPGEEIGQPGKMSLAFALSFRDPDRTLTDAEIGEVISRIAAAAASAGWTVR